MPKVFAWLLAIVGLMVVMAMPAFAHSEIRERAPGAGEVVSSIDHIDLLFWTPVASGEILLSGPDGEIFVGETSLSDAKTITSVEFVEITEPGRYNIAHTEISADNDKQTSEYTFVIAPEGGEVAQLFQRSSGPNWALLAAIGGVVVVLSALMMPSRK